MKYPKPDTEKSPLFDHEKRTRNDRGNAEVFLSYWDRDVLAVRKSEGNWKSFAEGRWKDRRTNELTPEFGEAVTDRYQNVVDYLKDQARKFEHQADVAEEDGADEQVVAKLREQAKRKAESASFLGKWAEDCGNKSRMTAGLSLAHNLAQRCGLGVDTDDFDAEPELLGVQNGILDLREEAAQLVPWTRDLLVSKGTRCDYTPKATHPELEAYFEKFLPDLEYRAFVQKVMGYSALHRGNPERLFVFLYGPTSTGKSVMQELVIAALGPELSGSVNLAMFRDAVEQQSNAELTRALGLLFIKASEASESNEIHSSAIKRLCGAEHVSSRNPHSSEIVDKVPDFTPVIATNEPPSIKDADSALLRRLLVLPFKTQVENDDEVTSPAKNPEVQPAMLAWLVQGYEAYKREGLLKSEWHPTALVETQLLFDKVSPEQLWWNTYIVEDPAAKTPSVELRKHFTKWKNERGFDPEGKYGLLAATSWISKHTKYTSKTIRVPGVENSMQGYPGIRIQEPKNDPE